MREGQPQRVPLIRSICAFLLAVFVLALVLPHAGHVVIDDTIYPPRPKVVGRTWDIIWSILSVMFWLSCIYVSMWKRWSFEVVGWIMLAISALQIMLH